MSTDTPGTGRSIDLSISLPVRPDVLWKALTDGEAMSRWFPLEARVTPGVGGSVWLSWGPDFAGEAPITAWEPERHLSTSQGIGPAGLPVAVDYFIEARDGDTTVLRVVQSGFGADAKWDDQYDATEGGWRYFLFNLKHYLTRHAGTPRDMVWDRRPPRRPRTEAWRVLLGGDSGGGAGAYTPQDSSSGAARVEGDRFAFALGAGEAPLQGTAVIVRHAAHFAGLIEGLNDALLFVEFEGGDDDSWHCGVWLSTYGLAPERVPALQRALTARMDAAFGAASAVAR